jgi:hypothetical protein
MQAREVRKHQKHHDYGNRIDEHMLRLARHRERDPGRPIGKVPPEVRASPVALALC